MTPRATWKAVEYFKACDCRAPAVRGGLRMEQTIEADAVRITATWSPGPCCVGCGVPWVELRPPPDFEFRRAHADPA